MSLELVREALPLTVYCADAASHDVLAAAGYHVINLREDALCEFLEWKQKGWPRLMWLKCECIRRALSSHEFVVFTDGDIVYERPGAVQHCVEQLLMRQNDGPVELLMQNDGLRDDSADGWGLCAGFMAARSTPAVRAAFEVDESVLTPGWDDQRYLNSIRQTMQHRALPLDLFPNGQYWVRAQAFLSKQPRPNSPFLVHYNWITGAEKRSSMERDGKWYVGDVGREEATKSGRRYV